MRIVVNFYLTWQCNFRCAHCIHECGPKVKDHMTKEQIDTAVQFLHWCKSKSHTMTVVGLTGGEPTTHPGFWDYVMPHLKKYKDQTQFDSFELHTNASRPIPEEYLGPYNKFFTNVFVGHDPFHRQFRKLNELFIDQYSELTRSISLRKNNYYLVHPDPTIGPEWVSTLRDKGRAAESLRNGAIHPVHVQNQGQLDCVWRVYGNDNIHVSFTPWHINHCGERSHPQLNETEENSGQFHPYNMTFDEILSSAVKYATNYCAEGCRQQCRKAYGKLIPVDEPVKVNQPIEEKMPA